MNKIFFFLCYFINFALFGQTIILQPDPFKGQDAIVHGLASEVNKNYGDNQQFVANSGTISSQPFVVRMYLFVKEILLN